MSESVLSFSFGNRPVRVVMKGEEPWWVAKDVCEVLEISNPSDALKRLDDDDLDSDEVTDSLGRPQVTNIVSESGLYNLVLGSRKPEARMFKRWVTHEVLPSIRKHGMYARDELLDNPDFLVEVATRLRDERRARLAAEAQLAEQKPMVTFAQTCMASAESILVRELAKIASKQGIMTGEKRLYQVLRDWGLILPNGTEPSQRAMEAGYFEVIQRPIPAGGEIHLRPTTKVTPKGQMYVIERLRREQAKEAG